MKSILFAISLLTVTQITTQKMQGQDSGFYLGGSIQGAAWSMPNLDFDTESGAGFGLKIGYNINTNFAGFLSFNGASIDPDVGESYGLGHFDIGAEGRVGNSGSTFRPFARISLVGMAAVQDNPNGDVEINGAGLGLGGGFYIFATENFAFELGLVKSWISIDEVKVGSNSTSIDEAAETGRFILGASYHF